MVLELDDNNDDDDNVGLKLFFFFFTIFSFFLIAVPESSFRAVEAPPLLMDKRTQCGGGRWRESTRRIQLKGSANLENGDDAWSATGEAATSIRNSMETRT